MNRMLAMAGLRRGSPSDFWALRNVSFDIGRGEAVGIIGPNGSGKSTLLQIISGILQPTTGRVLCEGRIAALLELGAGFNPEFSGRENVYLNGEIMGIPRQDMDNAFKKIEAFADIGAFMDRPLKEYSTGMYVRLAFSAAIHIDPEVLIVDEALSVGDAVFASRCVRKFEELRARKVTVLFVSHDLGLVKRLCDRALFLLNGSMVIDASANEAVNRYVGYVLEREQPERSAARGGVARSASFRHGDGASRITDVCLLNEKGQVSGSFASGECITIAIKAEFKKDVKRPVVGILIRTRAGIDLFGTNTRIEGIETGDYAAGDVLEAQFQLECNLTSQEYTLTVATQYPDGYSQDWLDDVLSFTVVDARDVAGFVQLKTRIEVRKYEHERQPVDR